MVVGRVKRDAFKLSCNPSLSIRLHFSLAIELACVAENRNHGQGHGQSKRTIANHLGVERLVLLLARPGLSIRFVFQ